MDIVDMASEREEELRQEALSAHIHPERLPSLTHCEYCGHSIPKRRQLALQGVSTCITCQEKLECVGR